MSVTAPRPVLDAIAVTATDMARSVAFYRLLGFDFDGVETNADHVEPNTAPGAVRLMIDAATLSETLIGEKPRPANHSAFAMLCAAPTEVDRVAGEIANAGFTVVDAPWDAFWGQRYATVADPDGYKVDLFAPL